MDVFVTFNEIDVECAFDVVVTDVEKGAFEVVISGVTGYPTDAQTESAFAKWMDKPGVIDSLLVIDTVSGAVASFVPNSMIQTVRGLTVDIEPQQDLHGYDNPWPAGGGKNKLKNNLTSGNINGLTVAVDADGVISFSGTATKITIINVNANIDTELSKGISYILSGCTGGSIATYRFEIYKRVGNNAVNYNGDTQFQLDDTDSGCICRIVILSGINMSGVKIYPMIRLATETDATYALYSNICPISGWTGLSVYVGATQDPDDATVYNVDWSTQAGTVYGGTLDATNGVLTVDRAMFTFTGAERFIENTSAWGAYAKLHNTGVSIISSVTNERTISSHFKKSSGGGWGSLTAGLFMTAGGTFIGIGFDGSISELQAYLASQYSAGTPVQVVALLSTPITVDLTPLEISVLTGQTNNVWADSGDVSVEYAADLKTYIDKKIAAAVAAMS